MATCAVDVLSQVTSDAVMIAFATVVTVVGAKRAVAFQSSTTTPPTTSEEQKPESMTMASALSLPVTASAFLVVMYVLFAKVQGVVVICCAVIMTLTSAFALAPVARSEVVAGVLGAALVGSWLCTGSWLAIDALGACTCVASISAIRVPNLKVGAACLCSLFFYDVFWVFCSSYFFGDNVMVAVANAPAKNPTRKAFGPEFLQLPIKFLLPVPSCPGAYRVLGLGDVAVPGLLVALAFRFDAFLLHYDDDKEKKEEESSDNNKLRLLRKSDENNDDDDDDDSLARHRRRRPSAGAGAGAGVVAARRRRHSAGLLPTTAPSSSSSSSSSSSGGRLYGTSAIVAYATGLSGACAAAELFDAPQPALLYLVPAVLLSVVGAALSSRNVAHLRLLWDGFDEEDDDEEDIISIRGELDPPPDPAVAIV